MNVLKSVGVWAKRVLLAISWPSVAFVGWALAIIFAGVSSLQSLELREGHRSIPWSSVQWGNMTELLGALGTGGALMVAGIVYLKDRHDRRVDEDRRIDLERRAQATQISGWVQVGLLGEAQIGFINASQGLIFDLQVVVRCEPRQGYEYGIFFPHQTKAHGHCHALRPGNWMAAIPLTSESMRAVSVDIYFRDHQNVRWRRNTLGLLVEAAEPPFPVPRSGAGSIWTGALRGSILRHITTTKVHSLEPVRVEW